jgi:hypothetical protein
MHTEMSFGDQDICSNPWDAITPAETVDLDWSLAAKLLRLDCDETALLIAHRRDAIPRRRVHEALGWTAARANRVRSRLDYKLARRKAHIESTRRRRGNSSRPWYLEQFESGRRCYSLDAMGAEFLEIMRCEAKSLS